MFMRSFLPALVNRAVMRPERLVDSWFDELFDDAFFAPVGAHAAVFSPAADLIENESEYGVRLEVPGIEAKDLSVEYVGDTLTIKGEKRCEHEDMGDGAHRFESRYGSFARTFRLDKPVDAEKIAAELKNGVLTVKLPKTEEARPRRIQVRQAEIEMAAAPARAAVETAAAPAATSPGVCEPDGATSSAG